MAICDNCGGDPDCTHKPELSAQLATQAARIEALEVALADMLSLWDAPPRIHRTHQEVWSLTQRARRVLAEGSVQP